MPNDIRLGPLSKELLVGAKYIGQGHDQYPAHQGWADELERLADFAASQSQFKRLQNPMLKGRAHEAYETLAEVRTSFFPCLQ